MILKNKDGSIELKFIVFSNNTLFGSLCGDSRKKKLGIPTNDSESNSEDVKRKKYPKKNPEDNLGSVIATLDTDRIDSEIDYSNIIVQIDDLIGKNGITYDEFFSSNEFVSVICSGFGINVRDLVSILMDNKPEIFNLNFIKNIIKPFVTKAKNAKYNYENETEEHTGYQPIFDFL